MIRTSLFLLPLALTGAACDAQAPAGEAQARPPVVQALDSRPLPRLHARVNDHADILPAKAEAKLTARLAGLETATTDQLVVLTVAGLQGEAISDYGLRVGRFWGVGRKGVDNGVLLIVAPNERQVRIEVGYGLEGLLTDERAAKILKERILPAFAQGRFERGIADGVDAIASTLESDRIRPRRRAKVAA